MKITILGAAGVRTPIIVKSILLRQDRLGVDELVLMDIDSERLSLIHQIIKPIEDDPKKKFKITVTTDSSMALKNADYVITTFRVGNIEHRIIDERVALENGVLGQETTGPGGFAMAMRTIPVLQNYVNEMKELCPDAWLLNFANPSGLLAEIILAKLGWSHAVGICDGPSSVQKIMAGFLGIPSNEIYLDYFGLNHLGWVRSVLLNGKNILPDLLAVLKENLDQFELPFSPELIESLQMLPNEYLYYYYYSKLAVNKILQAEHTRGEQILEINTRFFKDIKNLVSKGDEKSIEERYKEYQISRWESYMTIETGKETRKIDLKTTDFDKAAEEGYSGVALDIIETLHNGGNRILILNVLNKGAIQGMEKDDSVEIPVCIGKGFIQPMSVGSIPSHCLGLMQQVKAYEKLTIDAAIEGSYAKALNALTIHPLVRDEKIAATILEAYIEQHGKLFPVLK